MILLSAVDRCDLYAIGRENCALVTKHSLALEFAFAIPASYWFSSFVDGITFTSRSLGRDFLFLPRQPSDLNAPLVKT